MFPCRSIRRCKLTKYRFEPISVGEKEKRSFLVQSNNHPEQEFICPPSFIPVICTKIGTLVNIDLCLFAKVKLHRCGKEHSPPLEILSTVKICEVKPERLRLGR